MFGISDDKRLIEAIRDNSESAFQIIYDKYFTRLITFITKLSHNRMLAEEIAQLSMVKFWEQREKINITSSLKSYLYKMAYHEYLLHIRRESKYPIIEDIVIEAIDELSDDNDNQVLLQKVYKEINKLPPKCREVFIMSKIDGMNYKEISTHLGISSKTIESHMTKAFRLIRNALKD